MDFTRLGRTGLKVSVMGLGCGGHSRLGLSTGNTEEQAVSVVRAALDLGINFIDTAEAYKTEVVVGKGIAGIPRDQVILSTKCGCGWEDRQCTAQEMKERVNACLTRLQTDYVDVLHLHGVRVEDYKYACEELVPALQDLKTEGKIRHIGITEAFGPEPSHEMLTTAVLDDAWEVVMVGFNILNQSARKQILKTTQDKGIGTLCMFAIRRALSRPEVLRDLIHDLAAKGLVDGNAFEPERPLGFLEENGVAADIQDAAYRFCRYEPGMDVVLSGTGNIEHLKLNAASLSRPPLPEEVASRLRTLFKDVDCVSGN